MWIIGKHGVSFKELKEWYPEAVAYDESGFELDIEAMERGESCGDPNSRVLVWSCECESENDDGSRAIAVITWEDEV